MSIRLIATGKRIKDDMQFSVSHTISGLDIQNSRNLERLTFEVARSMAAKFEEATNCECGAWKEAGLEVFTPCQLHKDFTRFEKGL